MCVDLIVSFAHIMRGNQTEPIIYINTFLRLIYREILRRLSLNTG